MAGSRLRPALFDIGGFPIINRKQGTEKDAPADGNGSAEAQPTNGATHAANPPYEIVHRHGAHFGPIDIPPLEVTTGHIDIPADERQEIEAEDLKLARPVEDISEDQS